MKTYQAIIITSAICIPLGMIVAGFMFINTRLLMVYDEMAKTNIVISNICTQLENLELIEE